ncbi:hypothetical protein LTR95_012259 [Oleoguttula sp. CCFEE 5521]
MAQKKAAASFNEMIQADRQKRKNEQLAQEIFGKNRRQSAPTAQQNGKKAPLGGSLASRVGVTKRTASSPRPSSTPPRIPPAARQRPPRSPIDLTLSDPAPPAQSTHHIPQSNSSISFKGAAGGPYIVHASNFAPGTTAADIESVMKSVPGVGEMLYCRLLAATPTVIVEMSFAERDGAGKVVDTFNNKKADGRLLHVFLKDGGTVAAAPKPAATAPVETTADDSMEIDNEQSEAREAADREREQRRGRDDRDRRPENGWPNDREFPTGGRGGGGGGGYGRDDYYRGP